MMAESYFPWPFPPSFAQMSQSSCKAACENLRRVEEKGSRLNSTAIDMRTKKICNAPLKLNRSCGNPIPLRIKSPENDFELILDKKPSTLNIFMKAEWDSIVKSVMCTLLSIDLEKKMSKGVNLNSSKCN